MFTLDLQPPQDLPDNLRGEQWSFVQLPLSALDEELTLVKQVSRCPYLLLTKKENNTNTYIVRRQREPLHVKRQPGVCTRKPQ